MGGVKAAHIPVLRLIVQAYTAPGCKLTTSPLTSIRSSSYRRPPLLPRTGAFSPATMSASKRLRSARRAEEDYRHSTQLNALNNGPDDFGFRCHPQPS